jgi:predicted nuclease with TOPRIM domain
MSSIDATANSTAPMDTSADNMVTKESFDETKKLADERASELAAARAQLEAYQARDRSKLKSYQPDMTSLVEELSAGADVESKPHFEAMLDWSRSASERPNLASQMQLGTVIHACASKLKRVREEASVGSATADQLAAASKENENLKADNVSKDRRIGELSNSLKELQENSEKLQQQLQQAGALAEKFDFSKASSREEGAPVETAEDRVVVKTENASKAIASQPLAASPADALMAFVNSSSGMISSRFTPSSSNHALLGSTPSADASLVSALM